MPCEYRRTGACAARLPDGEERRFEPARRLRVAPGERIVFRPRRVVVAERHVGAEEIHANERLIGNELERPRQGRQRLVRLSGLDEDSPEVDESWGVVRIDPIGALEMWRRLGKSLSRSSARPPCW